jgi:methylaspartate mutase sigma subunit
MAVPHLDAARLGRGATVVVSSTASDSHMWNLVYLQLLLEEMGHTVVNLGMCVPPELLIEQCRRVAPDLVVVSSVNGHGFNDGMLLGPAVRAHRDLSAVPMVIGGKLSTDGEQSAMRRQLLRDAGFDHVFDDGNVAAFQAFIRTLTRNVA